MLTLLLILLPSQLAFHLWPSFSLINGVRSDYLSPTLYLTDILILALMLFNRPKFKVSLWILLIAVSNILFASSPLVSVYKWLRVYEYYWLYQYLIAKKIPWLGLQLAVVWTSALAIWQFVIQSSVGGLWYWLGERSFTVFTPGISKILGFGQLILRPYATLPHPNALAGFLLISGLLLIKVHKKAALLALVLVPLTFSKSAILVELALLTYWLIKKYKYKVFYLGFLIPIFMYPYLPTSIDSVSQRIWLNQESILIIERNWIAGVGLGNFVAQVPTLRQPVHNIYLLLMSELGIPATMVLSYIVAKSLSHKFNITILSVLAIGLVDHYWLTLHQSILLFVLLLAATPLKSAHDNLL